MEPHNFSVTGRNSTPKKENMRIKACGKKLTICMPKNGEETK
jgi:hypothetical protein